MLRNSILGSVYFLIVLEKLINYGLHDMIHLLSHSIIFFSALLLAFIIYERDNDDDLFQKSVIDDQIGTVTKYLKDNTNLRIRRRIPDHKFKETSKTIKKNVSIISIVIIILVFISHFYLYKSFVHTRNLFISVIVLTSIELLFSAFISRQFRGVGNNDIGTEFLRKVKNESTQVA